MKTRTKILIGLVGLALTLSAGVIYLRCGGKDISNDTLSGIAKHGEDISIYVDFGIDSAYPRFFVYDNRNDSLLASSKCAHGCGGGSTASKPVFSNKIGSNCSSLGEYKLTVCSRMYTFDMPCIRLDGLSETNSNIARRGVVIHEIPFYAEDISIGISIPVSRNYSQGCFGISKKTFGVLQNLMRQHKSVYLYAVYNVSE